MDQEELKAEVDAYMQDYDKKIAEVRSGWGGNPAKQFVWGEERKREDLLVPWPQVERAKGNTLVGRVVLLPVAGGQSGPGLVHNT